METKKIKLYEYDNDNNDKIFIECETDFNQTASAFDIYYINGESQPDLSYDGNHFFVDLEEHNMESKIITNSDYISSRCLYPIIKNDELILDNLIQKRDCKICERKEECISKFKIKGEDEDVKTLLENPLLKWRYIYKYFVGKEQKTLILPKGKEELNLELEKDEDFNTRNPKTEFQIWKDINTNQFWLRRAPEDGIIEWAKLDKFETLKGMKESDIHNRFFNRAYGVL